TIAFLRPRMDEVLFDAEHFFDGFRANRDYALATLRAAEAAGAHWLVLCDTNGGTLPGELVAMIAEVKKQVRVPLGIHVHNDAECAVANSLAAVAEGVGQVQGTLNGFGACWSRSWRARRTFSGRRASTASTSITTPRTPAGSSTGSRRSKTRDSSSRAPRPRSNS